MLKADAGSVDGRSVYAVRGDPIRRCLFALVHPFTVAAVVLLPAGGWALVIGAGYLGLLTLRSFASKLEADADGIVVSNRLLRHRIPWDEVSACWAGPAWGIALFPIVAVSRRRGIWFRINAYGTLGMSEQGCAEVVRSLTDLAAKHGHLIAAGVGSDHEPVLSGQPPKRLSNLLPECGRENAAAHNENATVPRETPIVACASVPQCTLTEVWCSPKWRLTGRDHAHVSPFVNRARARATAAPPASASGAMR